MDGSLSEKHQDLHEQHPQLAEKPAVFACTCLVCSKVGYSKHTKGPSAHCGISMTVLCVSEQERSHFFQHDSSRCREQSCRAKVKTWAALCRHTMDKHCSAAARYPCHWLGCMYSRDNGFKRPSTLKIHLQSAHRGYRVPTQPRSWLASAPRKGGGSTTSPARIYTDVMQASPSWKTA